MFKLERHISHLSSCSCCFSTSVSLVGSRLNLTCFFLALILICSSSQVAESNHGLLVRKSLFIVDSKSSRKFHLFLFAFIGVVFFFLNTFGSLMSSVKLILYHSFGGTSGQFIPGKQFLEGQRINFHLRIVVFCIYISLSNIFEVGKD